MALCWPYRSVHQSVGTLVIFGRECPPCFVGAHSSLRRIPRPSSSYQTRLWGSRGSISDRALDFGLIGVSTCGFGSHQGPFRSLNFPPSAPRLGNQRPWYVQPRLCDWAYKRSRATYRNEKGIVSRWSVSS